MKTATFHELLDNNGLAVEVVYSEIFINTGTYMFMDDKAQCVAVINSKYSFTVK